MTESSRAQNIGTGDAARSANGSQRIVRPEPTAWVGMVTFAAVIMIVVGAFQAIMGATALFQSDYYAVPSEDLLVSVDFTVWGWGHIALGAVAIIAAFGLLRGQMWARVVGICMAVASAIANLAFMPAYPLWSTVVIALDVLVIYAIAVHGREVDAY
jgi:hypothetical protein